MDEEYFSYALIKDPIYTPEEQKVISGWLLDYEGQISDGDRPMIAAVNLCYGYNTDEGCELWKQPECRNSYQTFELRSGYFGYIDEGSVYDKNTNLSFSDCREKCWNNCHCVGFITDGGTGCMLWTKDYLEFHQDYSGHAMLRYILISDETPQVK
ncbi:G-type lectin S-receptor-like serine/threonine-protein kinase SD1-13 [Camellia lanceoleosa]|uniref:G-type lectin S-receptor-like serine/threonine-protein kinase SD1-13 n=1 Tax=Camellia lanceoleosa TaxID=1840588 RepID=A0ACC0G0D1_9ERIC|nr:G-type lectin S-receptor-like serine/threonine-protein kinase SD1-13 [Camellia lanceoleosa]